MVWMQGEEGLDAFQNQLSLERFKDFRQADR